MKIMLETTDWGNHNAPNHVYVLNDSMTKLFAYVRAGTKEVFKFKKPYSFDTRGRTFVDLDEAQADVRDPNVIEVQGSKGNVYYLSDPDKTGNWTCTCTGYRYHGHCKHVAEIQQHKDPTT